MTWSAKAAGAVHKNPLGRMSWVVIIGLGLSVNKTGYLGQWFFSEGAFIGGTSESYTNRGCFPNLFRVGVGVVLFEAESQEVGKSESPRV